MITVKDFAKLSGIVITTVCAALVCNMFINFALDLKAVEGAVTSAEAKFMFDAQMATSKVVCGVTGGCLVATTFVMLVFYLKNYIDVHAKELGIMKALGYKDELIAARFLAFGAAVFAGCAIGYALSYAFMPAMYELQNKDGVLPHIEINFHASTVLVIILPTVFFAAAAFLYALYKMKLPTVELIRGKSQIKIKKVSDGKKELPFLTDLRRNNLKTSKISVFFIAFSAFCFSAMTQMSISMFDLASGMMAAMILIIGLVLAVMTMIMSLTAVVKACARTVAVMRAFGYSERERYRAVFDGYRIFAYAGFAIGTGYQFGLLKIMVEIIFKNIGDISYNFDYITMIISLLCFAVFYETAVFLFSKVLQRNTVKQLMTE